MIYEGDLQQEEVRRYEESLRVIGVVRLWDRLDHLQLEQQVVSVRQHWHGQGAPQVYRVQWTSWVANKQEHYWGMFEISQNNQIFALLTSGKKYE